MPAVALRDKPVAALSVDGFMLREGVQGISTVGVPDGSERWLDADGVTVEVVAEVLVAIDGSGKPFPGNVIRKQDGTMHLRDSQDRFLRSIGNDLVGRTFR